MSYTCHICTCVIAPRCAVLTGSPGSADPLLEAFIQEKLKGISREASDRNDKYRKCKQLLMVGFILFKKNKSNTLWFSGEVTIAPRCASGGEGSQLHVCRRVGQDGGQVQGAAEDQRQPEAAAGGRGGPLQGQWVRAPLLPPPPPHTSPPPPRRWTRLL